MKHSKKSNVTKTKTLPSKVEILFSELDLDKITRDLTQQLKLGDVVCLNGPLGAGKSTFIRSLLQNLGVKESFKPSPSFPIAIEYPIATRTGFLKAVHIDFYRLKSEQEIELVGIDEIISEDKNLCLIEWADRFPLWVEDLLRANKRVCWIDIKSINNESLKRTLSIQFLKLNEASD